jgi:hypothetical protein
MTENHPITPPLALSQQWYQEADNQLSPYYVYIAAQAARWGADQELEACCEWMAKRYGKESYAMGLLRAARRPQPPSLKEQALAELELLRGDANSMGMGFDAPAIRRALEALPE